MVDNTSLLGSDKCPTCSSVIDAATDPSGKGNIPTKGDITVCAYCSEILQFDKDLKVKYPDDEAVEYMGNNLTLDISKAQYLVKRFRELKLSKKTVPK